MKPIRFLLTALCAALSLAALTAQSFEARTFTGASGATLPYRLLEPAASQSGESYALVLFLHGAGERGSDNTAQLEHGTRLYLDPANRSDFPCYVVAPQCPVGSQWVGMPWGAPAGKQGTQLSQPMQLVVALLDFLMAEYPIDPDRVYVTGLSMGGYGTWDLATRYPERFAAAAPVCGGGDEGVAARAVSLPLWAFHSEDDGVVPVARSRNMIAVIRAAGGHPHYTEYAGRGHNAWTPAYAEPEFLAWLFAQRRGQPDRYVWRGAAPVKPDASEQP